MPESNRDKAIRLFQPNKDGISDWVPTTKFGSVGLNWGNNGNMRYGIAWGIKDIKWGVRRVGSERSAISHLRMEGWNNDHTSQQTQVIIPSVRRLLLALRDDRRRLASGEHLAREGLDVSRSHCFEPVRFFQHPIADDRFAPGAGQVCRPPGVVLAAF